MNKKKAFHKKIFKKNKHFFCKTLKFNHTFSRQSEIE